MEKILEKTLAYFPRYFEAFYYITITPFRSVEKRLQLDGYDKEASAFYFLSAVLCVFLAYLVSGGVRGDPFFLISSVAKFFLIAFLTGFSIFLTWRLFGSRQPLAKFLSVTFYFSGISSVLIWFLLILLIGVLNLVSPDDLEYLAPIIKGCTLSSSPPSEFLQTSFLMLFIFFFAFGFHFLIAQIKLLNRFLDGSTGKKISAYVVSFLFMDVAFIIYGVTLAAIPFAAARSC